MGMKMKILWDEKMVQKPQDAMRQSPSHRNANEDVHGKYVNPVDLIFQKLKVGI